MKKTRCISKHAYIKAFSGELSEKENSRMLAHLSECPECSRIFYSLKEVWNKSRELSPRIYPELERIGRKELKKIAADQIRRLKKKAGYILPSFQISRQWASAVGIAAVAVIVIFSIMQFRDPGESDLERTGSQPIIELLYPTGPVHAGNIEFKWSEKANVASYTLELYDIALDRIYRAELIQEESFLLPDEVTVRLQPGQTYFWKIIINLTNNERIESEFGRLVVSPS